MDAPSCPNLICKIVPKFGKANFTLPELAWKSEQIATICPISSDPFYIVTLLYKMGHYFLDTQYDNLCYSFKYSPVDKKAHFSPLLLG